MVPQLMDKHGKCTRFVDYDAFEGVTISANNTETSKQCAMVIEAPKPPPKPEPIPEPIVEPLVIHYNETKLEERKT